MHKSVVASAVAILIGGGTFALVVGATPGAKVEAPAAVAEKSTYETARIFSPANDVSPAPARDLIATKLAPQPVIWPEVPKPSAAAPAAKPNAAKSNAGKPDSGKPKSAKAKTPDKTKQAKNPTATPKPKKQASAATGTL